MPKSLLEGGKLDISLFFWKTDPVDWISNPAIHLNKVVLPQPEGPRKQTNSPSSILMDIFYIASKEPNDFDKLATSK